MSHYDPAMADLGYEREDNDFYPTETWVTKAAAEFMDEMDWFRIKPRPPAYSIWECAAGDGAMIEPLQKLGRVYGTDLVSRGALGVTSGVDFLGTHALPFRTGPATIITNPPYTYAEEFVRHALKLTEPVMGRVAMLLRNEWDCASERQDLLRDHPAYTAKLVLVSRPRWIRGSKGSPRHNYAWYFWDWRHDPFEYPIVAYSSPKRAYA